MRQRLSDTTRAAVPKNIEAPCATSGQLAQWRSELQNAKTIEIVDAPQELDEETHNFAVTLHHQTLQDAAAVLYVASTAWTVWPNRSSADPQQNRGRHTCRFRFDQGGH